MTFIQVISHQRRKTADCYKPIMILVNIIFVLFEQVIRIVRTIREISACLSLKGKTRSSTTSTRSNFRRRMKTVSIPLTSSCTAHWHKRQQPIKSSRRNQGRGLHLLLWRLILTLTFRCQSLTANRRRSSHQGQGMMASTSMNSSRVQHGELSGSIDLLRGDPSVKKMHN